MNCIEDLPEAEKEFRVTFSVPFTVQAYDDIEALNTAIEQFQDWIRLQLQEDAAWFESFSQNVELI